MDKELTPLEALERLYRFNDLPSRNIVAYLLEQENLPTYRKIIETALNDYFVYKQDYERVMKEKNSLLKEYAKSQAKSQKERKALEIIRIKKIDTALFKECLNIKEYNYWCLDKAVLTKEEYDLLKEILA